ncbi:transposase [Patescibacteria group bacterium]|nr:transposase [Patescibacteria group bacterium]MBU1683091.1 transposase [Patescibacteria group bacterium]
MPTLRVNKEFNDQTYFITMTVNYWAKIFDRHNRWNILANSLIYCQGNMGLKIYAYVFMLNHLHLIIQSPDVSGFIRRFKSYTARELLKNIRETEPEILDLFKFQDGHFEFWRKSNKPQLIVTDHFFEQKLNYIHNNPVKKKYVEYPEEWKWSSASWYENGKQGGIQIDSMEI